MILLVHTVLGLGAGKIVPIINKETYKSNHMFWMIFLIVVLLVDSFFQIIVSIFIQYSTFMFISEVQHLSSND